MQDDVIKGPDYTIHLGDCRDVMATLDAESVDSIVSDPPYGLSFMGKGWDRGVPGVEFWAEALRVAKPGAHLLAFGGTRTFHRLAVAIEDAGWEIRDCVMWVYGSGFPKSLDVSKAIDKAAGAVREVVGTQRGTHSAVGSGLGGTAVGIPQVAIDVPITAPATDDAKRWAGWHTALKPSWEPVIVARKPLVGTVAANVLAHGTGAINVDACRVAAGDKTPAPVGQFGGSEIGPTGLRGIRDGSADTLGRWPANLIHDGSDEVVGLFPDSKSTGGDGYQNSMFCGGKKTGGHGLGDTGSAARFFYTAKTSKSDREDGCGDLDPRTAGEVTDREDGSAGLESPRSGAGRRRTETKNFHPTVKPTDLMAYLCRLVTPPGGVVLDPFMGSGSTGRGAQREGFRFVGIELSPEYFKIAAGRLTATFQPRLL